MADHKARPTPMEVQQDGHLPLTEQLLTKLCNQASKSFFDEFGLINHQIQSYNHFVENGIHKLFDSIGEIRIKPEEEGCCGATIKFTKLYPLEKPMCRNGDKDVRFLPREARLRHMTYSSPIKVEVEFQEYALENKKNGKSNIGKEQQIDIKVIGEVKRDIVIGHLPVMVGSNLCWMNGCKCIDCDFDHGGYFLINGSEKIFVAQERICLKRLWVSNEPNWNISYRAELKRLKVNIEELTPHRKEVLSVFLSCNVPLWLFFFALDMPNDQEIVEMLDVNMSDTRCVNLLISTISYADDHFNGFREKENSLKYIDEIFAKSKFPPTESAKECIDKYIFPSFGSPVQKASFLVYIVKCLIQSYCGNRKCESKDDFRNKRFDLASELLERELQNHVKHAERRMVRAVQKDMHENRDLRGIEYYLDSSIITNGLSRAFSTGSWSHHFKKTEKVSGVVAILRRTNPLQTVCDMRKTRLQYAGKSGDARCPHPSHIGRVCFLSTPDGKNCGLVKNIAVTGLVSTNLMEPLLDRLLECGLEKLVENPSFLSLKGKDKVFLNGEWIGVCEDSLSFVLALRRKRRSKEVPQQVEIKRDQQQGEIRIFSDAGRIMRPLLVVENLKKINSRKEGYNFRSLLNEGIIELLGIEEEEDCQTAWGIKYLLLEDKGYTHCELDPSFMLGLSCGLIPFPNHDHCRRVLYQSEKHFQQAIGYPTTNPNLRVDTLSQQLHYPQRPLFHTMISDCLGKPEYPLTPNVHPNPEFYNGQIAIVAVNVHHGYNQEDSLVMNRASMERGMFRTEHIRSYKAEVHNKEARRLKPKDRISFGKVQTEKGCIDNLDNDGFKKKGCIKNLDDDGFPHIGADMKTGDVLIGKCAESGEDHSIKLKHTEGGRVQKVVLSVNDEGKNIAVVSLRQVRAPSVGDKFSSMHGQKGVIGFLESQENFPFTYQGIIPDIVINPHAFASRQTVGQLLEATLGKGIACGGITRYATPFTTPSVNVITEQLHR